ncbi:hypothetical protein ACU4GD_28855, partial [Cupriavidus basilensis]
MLPAGAIETPFNYRFHGRKLTLDDPYGAGVQPDFVVVKDGEEMSLERYSYMTQRRRADALQLDGQELITARWPSSRRRKKASSRSLDDTAGNLRIPNSRTQLSRTDPDRESDARVSQAPGISRTTRGTTIEGPGFNEAVRRVGGAQASLGLITALQRIPEGQRFNYAGSPRLRPGG